jgi:hypothetical protein
MPQPNDQYEPVVEEAVTSVPWSWGPAPARAMPTGECNCPADCPRDHENE